MPDEKYLSFDEASSLLGMDEDQLLNLVANNELRAFRISREMKFKEADVMARAQDLMSESGPIIEDDDDIVLLDESESPSSDVVELEDADSGVELEVEETVPEVVFASAETEPVEESVEPEIELDVSDDVDLIDIEEEAVVPEAEETVAASTAPIDEEESSATIMLDDSDHPETEDELSTISLEPSDPDIVMDNAMEDLEMPDSNNGSGTEPLLESSGGDGLGTEEIVFEDEDLAIGGDDDFSIDDESSETFAEDDDMDATLAIDEDEDDGSQTMVVSEEDLKASAGTSSRRRSGRMSGKASKMSRRSKRTSGAQSMRRRAHAAPKRKGGVGILWPAVTVLFVLAMIYPAFLMLVMHAYGETDQKEVFAQPLQEHEKIIRPMGNSFVHPMFKPFVDLEVSGSTPEGWWGKPNQSDTDKGEMPEG